MRNRFNTRNPGIASLSLAALTVCWAACGSSSDSEGNAKQTSVGEGGSALTIAPSGDNVTTLSGDDANAPSGDDATAPSGDNGTGGSATGEAAVAAVAPIVRPADPCIEAGTCAPGTWVNVTPSNVNLTLTSSNGNYGVQDVVADPVHPNDLYAFICLQGVWKSTNYGLTWAKIDTGTNSKNLDSGRPWGVAIDPNPNRDPSTPPALYTASGASNMLGAYVSTDGGVNWNVYSLHNSTVIAAAGGTTGIGEDVYSFDVDPTNSLHIIAGFHSYPGISESKDGGKTWATVAVPSGIGDSLYVWFINTGTSATSTTWLSISGAYSTTNGGVWRTTNSGGSWTQVQSSLQHEHGAAQIYQDGKGGIYAAGLATTNGVWRSTDYGKTWAPAKANGVEQNAVFATPTNLYAMGFDGNTTLTANDLHLQKSPATDGVDWSDWDPISPAGMNNGVKRVAVTYDGTHYIFVSGNWDAGIWRYIEP